MSEHAACGEAEVYEMLNLYGNSDINLYECGWQSCAPGHTPSPTFERSINVIHFIVSGKGTLRVGNRTYHLEAGQGFINPAGFPNFYRADDDDPWLYCWLQFTGIKLEEYLRSVNITHRTPVFMCHDPQKVYAQIREMMRLSTLHEPYTSPKIFSLCLDIFATLLKDNATCKQQCKPDYAKEIYIEKALSYMQEHLTENLNISEIASALNLNPNYFSTLFRRVVGCTPQSHLISLRLQYACSLLRNSSSSVKSIAQTVGYRHAASFSKAFAKEFGISPIEYRILGNDSVHEKPPADPLSLITKWVEPSEQHD